MKTLTIVGVSSLFVLASVGCGEAETGDDLGTETQAQSGRTAPKLECASRAGALVYAGRESQVLITADLSQARVLKNLSIKMPGASELGVGSERVRAQARYTPRSPTYRDHDKYTTADAWCGYAVIAPKELASRTGAAFPIYLQQSCEGGFNSTASLNCRVTGGGDGASAASIVLAYGTEARKNEVISAGAFEASDFTGTDIVVSEASTDIDIHYFRPGTDEEPASMCYRGGAAGAKTVLNAMLANTDGNGDHWLVRQRITEAAGALKVAYTVEGEGGNTDHELTFPRCN